MSGDTTTISSYQAGLDFTDLVNMEQDAWADSVSSARSPEHLPESSTASTEEAQKTDPSMSHSSEPTSNDINDDGEFGEFQSASTNPLKQPIYSFEQDDDTSTLLSKPDLEQTGIFTGLGLVQPMHAHLDASTQGLRRAGKLVLRQLQLKRESERLNLNNATVMAGPRHAELRELARVLANEGNRAHRGMSPGAIDGVVRPVIFGHVEVQREVAERLDGMVEAEKKAWND
jgi:hypothetical protein